MMERSLCFVGRSFISVYCDEKIIHIWWRVDGILYNVYVTRCCCRLHVLLLSPTRVNHAYLTCHNNDTPSFKKEKKHVSSMTIRFSFRFEGVRVKAALRRRIPEAYGRTFRVRVVHRQSFQIRWSSRWPPRQVGSLPVSPNHLKLRAVGFVWVFSA